jgi:tetratricopeptide (TPR) repeat protein
MGNLDRSNSKNPYHDSNTNPLLRLPIGLFLALLALLLSYCIWRIYLQPVATKRSSSAHVRPNWFKLLQSKYHSKATRKEITDLDNNFRTGNFQQVISQANELLAKHPEDIATLAYSAMARAATLDYTHAIEAYDSLLSRINAAEPNLYGGLLAEKLQLLMRIGDEERFRESCKLFLELPIPDNDKLFYLDQLACTPLYLNKPDEFNLAEFCARKALEIGPAYRSIQGTLGSILVEQCKFEEAEPYLSNCYHQSPALHDQGISGFYLALIAEHKGDFKTARTLARRSLLLYSEEWFCPKVSALIKRLDSLAAGSS